MITPENVKNILTIFPSVISSRNYCEFYKNEQKTKYKSLESDVEPPYEDEDLELTDEEMMNLLLKA